MNPNQQKAFDIVKNGHNLYIGGQAGCGKTYVVQQIVRWAQDMGKKVGLTCTTGIACSLYPNSMKAMTVQKWSGIGDGRFGPEKIVQLVTDDDRYSCAKQRILQTDLIIIDEVSMLSLKNLELLEYVLRHVRHSNIIFGAVQVVFVGDFLQLPPVRNRRYGDTGQFPQHHVFLKEVIRQRDEELSFVTNQLSLGILSEQSAEYMKSLTRPLPPGKETYRLFPYDVLVDMYNRDCLVHLPGQLFQFDSDDKGEEKYLNTLTVQKSLWLKVGAKVMLLRNMSEQIVNGLRGTVRDVRNHEVDVFFHTIDKLATLERMVFTVYDPATNSKIAERLQLSLKLCYAITIHKAQGMTLDRVEVDCRGIFQPGQLAVAMGRVKTVDGLRVVNFNRDAVIPQPATVTNYMETQSAPLLHDLSCCKRSLQSLDLFQA